MAVRLATSDPKPSHKNPGFHYFYYNKKTKGGSDCVALLPDCIKDIVKKGFAFDDSALRYDEDLGQELLVLDFDEQPSEGEPAVPPAAATGWGDHDHLAATETASPAAIAALMERQASLGNPLIPNSNPRPATARKHAAAARAAEHNLNTELWTICEQVCAAHNYISKRTGVREQPGAVIAQKLTAIAYIAYSNKVGISLSEDDTSTLLNI